jgi:hypothetical protein
VKTFSVFEVFARTIGFLNTQRHRFAVFTPLDPSLHIANRVGYDHHRHRASSRISLNGPCNGKGVCKLTQGNAHKNLSFAPAPIERLAIWVADLRRSACSFPPAFATTRAYEELPAYNPERTMDVGSRLRSLGLEQYDGRCHINLDRRGAGV